MLPPGILWPLVFDANQTIVALQTLFNIQQTGIGYRKEILLGIGDRDCFQKNSQYNLVTKTLGPVWFVTTDEREEHYYDVFRPILMKEFINVLHPFIGWPLMDVEKRHGTIAPVSAQQWIHSLIPIDIWSRLSSKDYLTMWWYSPTQALVNNQYIDIPLNQMHCAAFDSAPGVLLQRVKIPNPSEPYPGQLVDAVCVTLLTIEKNCHVPLAVAHFDLQGFLLRCQVNNFISIDQNNGDFLQKFTKVFGKELIYQLFE